MPVPIIVTQDMMNESNDTRREASASTPKVISSEVAVIARGTTAAAIVPSAANQYDQSQDDAERFRRGSRLALRPRFRR